MNRREFMKASAAAGAALMAAGATAVAAQELKPIDLPKSAAAGGNALIDILGKRKSTRTISSDPLPVDKLSVLLWAATGINRPDGKRTAPTANDKQEIDVYVAMANGLYLYDAKANQLQPVLAGDIRAMTGIQAQAYVKEAAVNLVYVADYSRMKNYYFGQVADETKALYTAAATGCIAENVYLYCASEGLATVLRAEIDRPALAAVMKLRPDQKIILAQSVGYPKKAA
jgi:nitroreductase